jgi:hypothetical protein
MGYFIANDGAQQGPFELADLPAHGLRADSLIWAEGMPDWQRAAEVPDIAALLSRSTTTSGPVRLQPLQNEVLPYGTNQPSNGMAVASLVLGICAIPMTCFHGIGVIPGILAIVFGFIARARVKRGEAQFGAGMALAGIICGFVPIVLILVALAFVLLIAIGVSTGRIK